MAAATAACQPSAVTGSGAVFLATTWFSSERSARTAGPATTCW